MKKRIFKLIVSVCIISCLMIGFCTSFASASSPAWLLRAKAGIAAAMLASNLVINPINAYLDDTLLEGIDPYGYVTSIQETPWSEYIDRSTIVVRPDVAVIDGVPYSEIWLGPDAAESLRLTGLDFASAYNILSDQSSSVEYAQGTGYIFGLPCYFLNNSYRSQGYILPSHGTYALGDATVLSELFSGNNVGRVTYNGTTNSVNMYGNTPPYEFTYFRYSSASNYGYGQFKVSGSSANTSSFPNAYVDHPFSFDYVSGDITVQPAPEDGLLMRVPSSYDDGQSGSVFNYDIHDLINIYPQVDDDYGHDLVFDPSLNPDFEVDLDMGNVLGDIITAVILAKLADLLGDRTEVVYAPMPQKEDPGPQPGVIDPLPDPDPAPDEPSSGTTIADTDWTKLDEILRWLQSTIDSIRHITESLQTMLDSLFNLIKNIIETLQSLPQQILEDIETGPSKVFRKALDILKSLFLPLLLPIKAMLGLWHYVVEWLQSVNSPFVWIFGIMSGTSANMVLPIYATLAGSICIAIYKALGR